MKKLTDIQGVIFDYGGTIDTNSRHWAEVLWEKYKELQVPVDKPVFREAYVHGERTLARQPLVKPEDNFYDVLRIKTRVQMDWLVENGILPCEKAVAENYASRIADACYAYVLEVLKRTRPVVKTLSEHYKLVLVSNFYGNIQAVLKDFGLLPIQKSVFWGYILPSERKSIISMYDEYCDKKTDRVIMVNTSLEQNIGECFGYSKEIFRKPDDYEII